MVSKQRNGPDEPAAATPGGGAPLFDPAVHLDTSGRPAGSDPTVYVELACSCGSVRRQLDPVSYVLRTVRDWHTAHAWPDHRPVSLADAVTEREVRRESAHRAAGNTEPYQPALTPQEFNTEALEWPQLDTAGTAHNTTREG